MKAPPAVPLLSALLLLCSPVSCHASSLRKRQLAPPAGLENGWTYQGCYVDVGRTLGGPSIAGPDMTNKKCADFCFRNGHPYAGTEYHTECYCGDKVAVGGVKTDDQDCGMPCGGDASQACGGPKRLTLYRTSKITGPTVNPGVDGWASIGCYTEGTTGRALTQGVNSIAGAQMTVAKCTAACKAAGYILAGVEFGSECYCGKRISNGAKPADGGCNMPCRGNGSEFCGGTGRLNVYDFNMQFPTSTSESATTTAAPTACPEQPAAVGSWLSHGCYSEAPNGRTLGDKTYADNDMTLAACAAFCAGYSYFGVEYARECYCGNAVNPAAAERPGSECAMVCSGADCQYCGAGSRLSVYKAQGGGVDPRGTTTGAVAPVVTGLPDGWASYGCWIDGVSGRILKYQAPDDAKMTLASCVRTCAGLGYSVAGAEYSRQCFCGNQIVNGGARAKSESECNTGCGGDGSQNCGGPGRMSIMSTGEPQVVGSPQVIPRVGDWVYQGCIQDNVNQQRTFFWQNFFEGSLTPAACLKRCGDFGYMAAGLEYGRECYCGDPANVQTAGAKTVDDKQCNVPCSGNSSALCGGGGLLTTYFWEGDPFYSWAFPEAGSPEAGSYDLLIGGVCVPLMTSQAITGKVTFLEKWGTGPPNSTGAYELDLSVLDDFKAAWRPMHVKTDIFCAGGITLPDRAGRQLNVGGWSGTSTYGVRLYTPDGSAGVPGKNDWQENVDVLKLQNGRWYPSAMVMANGSILIIGGEVGSNSAAVPTLELFPPTGTKPLYMEWLERTNPNNLYPFVCVLPSGGIFVAYWNEARVLDEVTFATVKTLPNMPGAVNDPKGGRSYPLEGAAVLLPQRAPYDEPLGVLICGGSTEGPSNALDNCVSTQPDAPEPRWTLERMPSPRVMPCMAPLPDGTYMILNGARHGVAGFGLGKDPNLSALLYDPARPAGHRITVMANTTVARLYHSEAITLLDGRVLVSGSDPQDGVHPQEYRVETFTPPYLLRGRPRPTFTLDRTDWAYGQQVSFSLGGPARNGALAVSLLGSVSSTHGNSMGARTIFPAFSCAGASCAVTAPPGRHVCPPGWYQFFVLDGGVPAVGVFVRIGGDPARVGDWPAGDGFTRPGV